jgi:tRNA (guanine-N7-)-methyltransferase
MQLIESRTYHFVNPYIRRMELQEEWVYDEEKAQSFRGQWATHLAGKSCPLHVEIGTGNGFHFAHYAETQPNVALVGFEIKFKTAVQSIERTRATGATQVRMLKADARKLSQYFSPEEVEKVIIHFPDPWPKRRQQKNRLMNKNFFKELEVVLTPGGTLEFKTDHFGYFQFAARHAAESNLVMTHYTEDLHHSFLSAQNFVTAFEALFLKKGQRIFSFTLQKN